MSSQGPGIKRLSKQVDESKPGKYLGIITVDGENFCQYGGTSDEVDAWAHTWRLADEQIRIDPKCLDPRKKS